MSRHELSKVACSHGVGPGSFAIVLLARSKAAVAELLLPLPTQLLPTQLLPLLEEVEKRSEPSRVEDCASCGLRRSSSSSSCVAAAERAADSGLCGICTRCHGGPNPTRLAFRNNFELVPTA